MAEASLSPVKDQLETTGRKRTASETIEQEADGSPDNKKVAFEQDPLDELMGQYPYNIKRTCILHDHSNDANDPEGHQCAQFESEFGNYDANLFIDQNEAEDLLATLEVLSGKLAAETQPLSLEYTPSEPAPLPLQYEYPPMLGWTGDTKGGADNKMFNIEDQSDNRSS